MTTFGRLLHRWMLDQRPNITPAQLRDKLFIKTGSRPALQTIHNWLNGDTRPTRFYLPALAAVTGIPQADLEAAAGYEPITEPNPVEQMIEKLVRRTEREQYLEEETRRRFIDYLRRFRDASDERDLMASAS
jgi:hypothetical protein